MSSRHDQSTLRVPPHSIDSEQSVLGGLMVNQGKLAEVSDWLREEDFYRKDHRLIYRAIRHLSKQDKPVDAVTMGDFFDAQGFGDLVPAVYVISLSNNVPSAANLVAYAEIVKEKARLRELIDIGTELVGKAFEPHGAETNSIAMLATQKITKLHLSANATGLTPIADSIREFWSDLHDRYSNADHGITGLSTPWADVNDLTNGLQQQEVIILAGRPSSGKTALAFQQIIHTAIGGGRVLVFSLEMPKKSFIRRCAAALARIDYQRLRKADLTETEWAELNRAVEIIRGLPIYIDDTRRLASEQIVARAKRQLMRDSAALIVIDHLHEIRRVTRDPTTELGDIVREQRELAQFAKAPLLLLAQLSRPNADEKDSRPSLRSLRGSGGIEEVADVAFFVHREQQHNPKTHLIDVAEIIVGKGRDLPAGKTIYLRSVLSEMRFEDWIGELPQPPKKEEKKNAKSDGFAKSAKPDPRSGDQ